MMKLNFDPFDKTRIEEAENKRGYTYYDFTEESCKALAAKHVKDLTYPEWCSFVQMLYPHDLICSGLFEPFLVFHINKKNKRQDPPAEHWENLMDKGSNGILIERIVSVLVENGIEPHESWKSCLETAREHKSA